MQTAWRRIWMAGIPVSRLSELRQALIVLAILMPALSVQTIPAQQRDDGVATYHNDPERTGWNPNETILTTSNVNALSFGLLKTVALDGRVDAQPLVVPPREPSFRYDVTRYQRDQNSVVYVATENNTVYAIDGSTGDVLMKRNLGPVMVSPPGPGHCDSRPIGITGTPTIDRASNTLFVIAATMATGGIPQYQLHALDLATLADHPGSPVVVQAWALLGNGSLYSFTAAYQQQRPALLESFGRIYAGFGSIGDCFANFSRGWLLGWDEQTMAPLPLSELTNQLPSTAAQPYFLSSIWMSGYGLSADSEGSIYFSTGNSGSGTYDGTFNLSESAVKVAPQLSSVVGVFTPSDVDQLDDTDEDFGAGGMMIIPDNSFLAFPHLALAGGKDGRLFILDRDNMGGLHTPDVPNQVSIGGCWCGPSYFGSADGPRVITSGGTNLSEWAIGTENDLPSLSLLASVPDAVESTLHNPGFFTSVSSNAYTPGTAIIWAVGHGSAETNTITLHAFNATPSNGRLPVLWTGPAGLWYWNSANPNIVPTVAMGHVYVASDGELDIFGIKK